MVRGAGTVRRAIREGRYGTAYGTWWLVQHSVRYAVATAVRRTVRCGQYGTAYGTDAGLTFSKHNEAYPCYGSPESPDAVHVEADAAG